MGVRSQQTSPLSNGDLNNLAGHRPTGSIGRQRANQLAAKTRDTGNDVYFLAQRCGRRIESAQVTLRFTSLHSIAISILHRPSSMYNGYRTSTHIALFASADPHTAPQGYPPPGGYPPYMPPTGTPQGFRPPMPGMPMPTLPPQQAYPGSPAPNPGFRPGMPPFAPSPYGVPPPQPTGMSPNANGFRPAPGLGFNGGAGGGAGYPPGGGYGFDQGAMGLPRPPHLMPGMVPGGPGMMGGMEGNPNFVKPAVKTTAVYIGGIPDGINDSILTGIIQVSSDNPVSNSLPTRCHKACGPLHKLNRVTNANGKQAGFGFAEFEDPEVVLRCLKCLHGTELPDITPRGRQEGLKKTLVVRSSWTTNGHVTSLTSSTGESGRKDESVLGRIRRAEHPYRRESHISHLQKSH